MIFQNEFFKNLALTVCTENLNINPKHYVIEIETPGSMKPSKGLLELLYANNERDGVKMVCFKNYCYDKNGMKKTVSFYKNITIFVNFNTQIFYNPLATKVCGVPTVEDYWTGRNIDIDHYVTKDELKAYLDSLNLKPFCVEIAENVYKCPAFYQNRKKIMDCSDIIVLQNTTLSRAESVYQIFKKPVYIVSDPNLFCKKITTENVIIPPPATEKQDLLDFVQQALIQYSLPNPPELDMYISQVNTLVVPQINFEMAINESNASKVVQALLKRLAELNLIQGYCEEVTSLKYGKTVIRELERLNTLGMRCTKWSS
ncbi:VP2 [Sulfolobus filamentous virus 1]|uniref:VP2 n=2 Tax=Alphalipothrixvirus beppuense TaxID=2734584 RepID=A0A346LU51_SUFV1|nr:VP2 [Sulfolobus filamentous virus 1]AXQ00094.1 VP2 [Sulfolobus filamentous virus 1]AZI75714.1 putative viral structural protein [Sulfolobales Beppu filamentous phage 1]